MSDQRTLTPEEQQAVLALFHEGERYMPDGSGVKLMGFFTADDLLDIAIELEAMAKQTDATVAAFDYLMDATA